MSRPLISVLAVAFALLTTSVHAAPEAIYKQRGQDGIRRDVQGTLGDAGGEVLGDLSIWWTDRIANPDPDMLATCPLHISVVGNGGKTAILMLRPSVLARGSRTEGVAATLESELIGIIDRTFVERPVESAPQPAPGPLTAFSGH